MSSCAMRLLGAMAAVPALASTDCAASEDLLLQVRAAHASRRAAGATPAPTPEEPGDENATVGICDVSCVTTFVEMDGCSSMFTPEEEKEAEGDDQKQQELFQALGERQCDLTPCMDEVIAQCTPAQGCDACVAGYNAVGGCSRITEIQVELLPEGCLVCAEAVWGDCTAAAESACAPCKEAVASLDRQSCEHLDDEEVQGPEACRGCPQAISSELISSHCDGLQEVAENCHTTKEGEACFGEVRWAMERGIVQHPDWYEDMDRSSGFEAFQQLLHERKPEVCQQPCKAAPLGPCHTAALGEECYRHAVWARDVGIRLQPDMYPQGLTNKSSLENFQAWLHHVHHGSCQKPCDTPSK